MISFLHLLGIHKNTEHCSEHLPYVQPSTTSQCTSDRLFINQTLSTCVQSLWQQTAKLLTYQQQHWQIQSLRLQCQLAEQSAGQGAGCSPKVAVESHDLTAGNCHMQLDCLSQKENTTFKTLLTFCCSGITKLVFQLKFQNTVLNLVGTDHIALTKNLTGKLN